MYDVLIVGGGPAGCSAALTLRMRNKTVLMAYAGGGALEKAHRVDNYPGLPRMTGPKMLQIMRDQARYMGTEMKEGVVQRILPMGASFTAMIGSDLIEARSVLLCTGAGRVALLSGEQELVGMGVSYCATCDGMFYRGKRVAVIGSWEEAAEEANFLSTLASKVTYYAEKPHDTASLHGNIALSPLKPVGITSQDGEMLVETEAGSDRFDGVFVLRPAMALSQLMPELETVNGKIKADEKGRTSIPKVLIAGDLAGLPYQIAKAVGDGNTAALTINKLLDDEK